MTENDLSNSSAGDCRIKVFNPATLKLVGEVRCTHIDNLADIVASAREAQREWYALTSGERRKVLLRTQANVLHSKEELIKVIMAETGKPRIEAIGNDIMAGLSVGDYCIDVIESNFQERKVDYGRLGTAFKFLGRRSFISPRPLGVIGIISPWNYPFGIPYSQTIMALAAGNAVVLKPSSYTPMTASLMKELFDGSGVPEGLVNVVYGSGGTVGKALISSGVDRIIFTGSGETGRQVMSMAAQTLTPVTLELGGKDPMIVLPDADIERAVKAAVWGSFVNAGQTCACVKRIYVHEKVIEGFARNMVNRTSTLKIGDGSSDPTVSVGPLISEEAVAEMERTVAMAVGQGGKVLIGGSRVKRLNGHFFEPTIIGDVTQDMEVCQNETFGPIVALLPFKTEEEAIHFAWDNPHALTASVWTDDLRKGNEIARRLPGGTVMINNCLYTYGLGATPWGGSKGSGFGRTHGELGFMELVDSQHIHVDDGRYPRDLWWSPYDKEALDGVEQMMDGLFKGRPSEPALKLVGLRKLMRRRD
ncbi:MAG: aldehyde dehydrogenase family protein [Euryarchaeota archaeon]|nr:aldehyde dehydrogenase family protein [Euryarchaeota archaeon]